MTATERVSVQQVQVFEALERNRHRWVTCADLANQVATVPPRTVRRYLREWARLGLVERAEVHPGPTYRLDPDAESRAGAFLARVREAADRFGGA